jgi:hypothetical protein
MFKEQVDTKGKKLDLCVFAFAKDEELIFLR